MEPNNLNRWGSRHLPQEAAALAFMRRSRYDIRPALLLLFHAQDGRQFPATHLHGVCYLRVWCEHRGIAWRHDVLELAAADALAVMWRRKAPQPVGVRAKQLGVRIGTYFDLRTAALEMFQTRLHEAQQHFLSGKIYTRRSVFSKIGTAPPRQSSRAAAGNPQQLFFQWAA
ncbi:hypothetical protein GCM10027084_02300 [Pseudoxanthomonas sangjuensis]|uniref:hypothetical protein n=1 Tax=Pseudoxanthomonas sangjuensis TaxID=1503750 RepID=UPI001392074A|nr:hypothetical protein [Pseudoxanthomonas sangjuensis]KAF1713885.1 hypothetical protein CSC71_05775 [Pseudoxanthomonas sangjuensis]